MPPPTRPRWTRGCTVAVIGTGPDRAYPDSHARLQARIAAEGVVLSEYLPGTPARPGHFPARNRLVAGLALATVVVEAAQRSGALITARPAAEAGREVCALPGSVLNPRAAGCHRLIREGAALVERPEEVLELLAPPSASSCRACNHGWPPPLNRHRLHACRRTGPTTLTTSACGGRWSTTQAVWIH